jgi:hypothetical protein
MPSLSKHEIVSWGNPFLRELRGRGPVADTGDDASPLVALAPQGDFLDGKPGAYLRETTTTTETTWFWA